MTSKLLDDDEGGVSSSSNRLRSADGDSEIRKRSGNDWEGEGRGCETVQSGVWERS